MIQPAHSSVSVACHDERFGTWLVQGDGFIINHYAGPVGYLIEGFVDKNRDTLPGELTQLFTTSSNPLLVALFKPGGEGGRDGEPVQKSARGGGARGRSGGGGKRTTALAAQFAGSLDELMAVLQRTTPHFVRCVKPNFDLKPNQLDGANVMRQLREMGMVHVVRARKMGFAHRYTFERFLSRYGYLLKNRQLDEGACAPFYTKHLGTPSPATGDRKQCVTLLATKVGDGVLDADGWAVGTGKVFLKEAQQQQLEVAREAYLLEVVTEQLRAAVEQREIPPLESAIALAIEVKLSSPLLAEAQQLLKKLQDQQRAMVRLEEAMRARDVGTLEAALVEAHRVELANAMVTQAQQLRNRRPAYRTHLCQLLAL